MGGLLLTSPSHMVSWQIDSAFICAWTLREPRLLEKGHQQAGAAGAETVQT